MIMANYMCAKPCRICGTAYTVGTPIKDGVINSATVQTLLAMGYIRAATTHGPNLAQIIAITLPQDEDTPNPSPNPEGDTGPPREGKRREAHSRKKV